MKCKIYVLNVNLCLYFLVFVVASSVSFCTWIWFSCCPCFGCIVENGFLASDWRIQFKGLTRSVHLWCPYFQMCIFVYNISILLFFWSVWSTVILLQCPYFRCALLSTILLFYIFFLKCVEHCATFSPPLNCRSYSQLTQVSFLLICRYCQQLWNSLPPMTELFELVSCNILINLENHYRHKLLTSKYAFNDKKMILMYLHYHEKSVTSVGSKSWLCYLIVLSIWKHLVFPTRFTLM